MFTTTLESNLEVSTQAKEAFLNDPEARSLLVSPEQLSPDAQRDTYQHVQWNNDLTTMCNK